MGTGGTIASPTSTTGKGEPYPKIKLIAAMAENYVIGDQNQLPWHIPEDLSRFRRLTLGKSVLMGRKTHESIGRALGGRHNIVVSKTGYWAPEVQIVESLEDGIRATQGGELWVIGGQTLFEQTLPLASRVYLTTIHQDFYGDRYFPVLFRADWHIIEYSRLEANEDRDYGVSFVTYERR